MRESRGQSAPFFGNRPKAAGFTIVELVVVLGILSLLFAVGLPAARNFQEDRNYDLAGQSLLQALRRAQIRSLASEDGANIGVHLISGTGTTFTIFEGSSFAGRVAGKDESSDLPPSVGLSFNFSGGVSTADVIFSRIRGKPIATGTVFLYSDGAPLQGITIGREGRIQIEQL